jgi:two-component system sensor histidine kinase RpfC
LTTDKECAFVRVEVEDTGVGIPKAKLNTIFEAFAQADDSITRVYGGTGLGTTIARQLVLLMGGKIGVESNEGSGSRFWFELPMLYSKVQDSDFAVEVATRTATLPGRVFAVNGTPVTRIRGARVLVAEDNVTNQRVTQLILESRGHAATIVSNGESALDELEKGGFDVALFDLSMPMLSGLEALKLYRFSELNPIPVIILSANVTTDLIAECTRAGAAEFVAKPVRASVLLDAIERQLADRVDELASRVTGTTSDDRPALSLVQSSALDPSVLAELMGLSRDETFVERLLQGFSDDCHRLVDEIVEHISARRYEAAKDSAHALKGGAGGVGATQLMLFASRFQKLTHEDIRTKAPQLVEELRHLRDETLKEVTRASDDARAKRTGSSAS